MGLVYAWWCKLKQPLSVADNDMKMKPLALCLYKLASRLALPTSAF